MMTKTSLPLLAAAMTSLVGLAACIEIDTGPPDMQSMKESRPLGGTKDLAVRLNYDIGSLEVRSAKGNDLFSLNLDYDARRSTPRFDFEAGDHGRLNLSMNTHAGLHSSKRGSDLNLRLNPAVPLDLDFSTGVSDAHLDMTDMDIKEMRLRGGVGRTEVQFDHPVKNPMTTFEVDSGVGNLTIRGLGNARVERLKVNGGVGRTELDFTGDSKDMRTDSEINVGVGQVRLVLPREAEIVIEGEGSFLSNISAPGFDKDGHTYTHHGTESGGGRINIRVRSGVGGVTVELT